MPFTSSIESVALILAAMPAIAMVEALVPLRARSHWNRVHLGPNLALTFITFATNVAFNTALVMTLAYQSTRGFGLLPWLGLSPLAGGAAAVVALDFSSYAAHVGMHTIPSFWRIHSVHHSDPAVDVTTTVRQHPGEGVIRYAVMAVFAFALGATPGTFAVYRSWSAINALLEHANIRVPPRLDALVSLVITSPNMHKVHHSRIARETNTNYGNIFSVFDRLFSTFTPARRGATIVYGLDGFDDPARQTTRALLALPFVARRPPRDAVLARRAS